MVLRFVCRLGCLGWFTFFGRLSDIPWDDVGCRVGSFDSLSNLIRCAMRNIERPHGTPHGTPHATSHGTSHGIFREIPPDRRGHPMFFFHLGNSTKIPSMPVDVVPHTLYVPRAPNQTKLFSIPQWFRFSSLGRGSPTPLGALVGKSYSLRTLSYINPLGGGGVCFTEGSSFCK